jgi:hypothetical protein
MPNPKKIKKYQIDKFFNAIPVGEFKMKRAELISLLKTTAMTLGEDLKGFRKIPGERLAVYADFFKVDIEDLVVKEDPSTAIKKGVKKGIATIDRRLKIK